MINPRRTTKRSCDHLSSAFAGSQSMVFKSSSSRHIPTESTMKSHQGSPPPQLERTTTSQSDMDESIPGKEFTEYMPRTPPALPWPYSSSPLGMPTIEKKSKISQETTKLVRPIAIFRHHQPTKDVDYQVQQVPHLDFRPTQCVFRPISSSDLESAPRMPDLNCKEQNASFNHNHVGHHQWLLPRFIVSDQIPFAPLAFVDSL